MIFTWTPTCRWKRCEHRWERSVCGWERSVRCGWERSVCGWERSEPSLERSKCSLERSERNWGRGERCNGFGYDYHAHSRVSRVQRRLIRGVKRCDKRWHTCLEVLTSDQRCLEVSQSWGLSWGLWRWLDTSSPLDSSEYLKLLDTSQYF